MKKKIIISIIAILMAGIIGVAIGYFKNNENKIIDMENPTTITYFSDLDKTESFSLQIPNKYCDKIFISIDEETDGLQSYKFKHLDSGEVLFIVYISKGNIYEKIDSKYEVLKQTENYTYVWVQSVAKNKHIENKEIRAEFEEIAEYYATIKSTVKINISQDKED